MTDELRAKIDRLRAASGNKDFAGKQDKANGPTGAEAEIARLASLPHVNYEREREAAAEKLGVRVGSLDTLVKACRKATQKSKAAPASWTVAAATEAVAGDRLLNAQKAEFEKYLVLPPHTAVACALWTMHTWTIDAVDISPILGIISPEKRCGKTTLLKILNRLTRRPTLASNISAPALFRYIEAEQPTLLIDEADSFLKDNEEMRGILNSGHSREAAFVIRCEGDDMTPRKFSTWAAKAIACIKKLPPTLTDRSITVPMWRKLKTQKRPRYRDFDRDDFKTLRSQALRWVTDNQKKLSDNPAVPDTLDDRAADNWRPLLAIAEITGGEWPELARQAALALSGGDDDSAGVRLLRDIKWIFNGKPTGDDRPREYDPVDQMSSKELVAHLVGIEDSDWADWQEGKKAFTQTALARLLEPFHITSENIRVGDKVPKGYKAARFKEAFDAYLTQAPEGGNFAATPLQANKDGHNSQNYAATDRGADQYNVAAEKPQKPQQNGPCSAVAGKNPPLDDDAYIGAALGVSDDDLRHLTKSGKSELQSHHDALWRLGDSLRRPITGESSSL